MSKLEKLLAAIMHMINATGLNKPQRHELYTLLKNAIKDDMPTMPDKMLCDEDCGKANGIN